jgi:hypothetical protein
MDVITDQYENISINQLYTKLSSKYAQLNKLEKIDEISSTRVKDYIETTPFDKNYDDNDFARVLSKFKNQDSIMRTHEQTHASIGHTTSPISYNYQEGPDGKLYVVGGHVRMDTSIPSDPKSAAFKLDMLLKAASGPTHLSNSDATIGTQSNLNKILLEIQGAKNGN